MNIRKTLVFKPLALTGCLVALLVCGGCDKARVTVLFAANADPAKDNLPQEEIASLVVTVSGVSLLKAGGEGEEVPLTVTPQDVDLVQLDGVAAMLTSAEIPTGVYNQIRLNIENPRLVLAAAPETVVTDVHLAANSRFFVAERFAAYAGTQTNIVLDIEGIHLVREGNGGYTLTPMLRARFREDRVPAVAQGVVVSVDAAAGAMVLGLPDADVPVNVSTAAIFLPGDTDTATGTLESLTEGAEVLVEGEVNAGGRFTADRVTLLPAAA